MIQSVFNVTKDSIIEIAKSVEASNVAVLCGKYTNAAVNKSIAAFWMA